MAATGIKLSSANGQKRAIQIGKFDALFGIYLIAYYSLKEVTTPRDQILSFVNELKRRNVLRVAVAYLVAAWLVIQVVETLFPIYGLSDASIRIVISILAIGLIPTLIFAWAFELTPEGLKKESEVDRSLSITAHTGRKLDRMIMVVLALALGYFAFDKFVLSESREATLVEEARQEGRAEAVIESHGDQSIAVLPFVNMSDEPANEYFSEGLSEEILNLLAKIPDLKVIGRTSSFAFKGSNEDLRSIGGTLGVKTLLEGSVRKSGEQVRVTAQLIDAADGSRIWSETYDRTMTDIFAVQDDVAAAIIDALQIHVGKAPTRGRPTENPEAYALFLKARVAANGFDMPGAEALLTKAVELDPNFAEAYELLSLVYWVIPSGVSVLESQKRMGETAAKALALEPDLVLARTYYDIAKSGPGIRLRTIEAFERAARERPYDPSILEGFAFLLTEFGYLQEAVAVAEQYLELDPLAELANYHWPLTLYAFGRTEEAVAALEFANYSDFAPHLYRWAIEGVNLVENRTEITITNLQSWLKQHDYPTPTLFRELVSGARDPATGQAYLDRRIPQIVSDMAEVDDFDWHNGLTSLYLYFGYLDRYYELVFATEPVDTTWHPAGAHLWRSAIFRRLGSTAHPKYVEFAEMMGIIDIWEQRGPPDFCEKVDGHWVCE